MNFINGLIFKILLWLGDKIIKLLVANYKKHQDIVESKKRAIDNLKKIEESKTDEERRKHVEDLLNNS